MEQQRDNIAKLHESLTKRYDGFTVSLDQFIIDMQDESNRRKLHENLGKTFDGFTVDFDTFSSDILKKKDEAPVGTTYNPFSDQSEMGIMESGKSASESISKIKDEAPEGVTVQDIIKDEEKVPLFNQLLKEENERLVSEGLNHDKAALNASIGKMQAKAKEMGLEWTANSVKSIRSTPEIEIEKYNEEFKDLTDNFNKYISNKNLKAFKAFGELSDAEIAEMEVDDAKRMQYTEEAGGINKEDVATIDLLNNSKEAHKLYELTQEQGTFKNLSKGAKEGLKEYIEGYSELSKRLQNNKQVQSVLTKWKEDKELTEDDIFLLKALQNNEKMVSLINEKLPSSYNIGKSVGQSVGFMGEFALTAGYGAAAKQAVVKGIAKAAGVGAKKSLPRTLSAATSTRLAAAGVQTAAMPTFYKGVAERTSKGENFSEALLNQYWETGAENLSERLFLGKVKGAPSQLKKLAEKTGIATVGAKNAKELLLSTGEEFVEEKFNEIITAAQNYDSFNDFAKDFTNWKKNLEMAASVGIVSTSMFGVSKGADALSSAEKSVKDKILNESIDKKIKPFVDEIVANEDLTIEQKNELIVSTVNKAVKDGLIKEDQAPEILGNSLKYGNSKIQTQVQEEISGEQSPVYKIDGVPYESKNEFLNELNKRVGEDVDFTVDNDEKGLQEAKDLFKEEIDEKETLQQEKPKEEVETPKQKGQEVQQKEDEVLGAADATISTISTTEVDKKEETPKEAKTQGINEEVIEPKKKLRTTAKRGIKEGAAKETVDIILEKGTKNEYDKDKLKTKAIDSVIEATDERGNVDMDKLTLDREKGELTDKEYSYASAAVFDMYKTKAKDTKLPEEERLVFARKAAEVLDVRSARTESLGQEIELEKDVINDFPAFSAKVKQINKLGREKDKALKTKRTDSGKSAKKYTEEVYADLQKEISVAVEEAVKAQKSTIESLEKDLKVANQAKQVIFGKEEAKKIADKIRKAKTPKDLAFATPIPIQAIWNPLIETVALTVEATGNISEAIQKGLKQVRESDWYKGLSKEEQTRFEEYTVNNFSKGVKKSKPTGDKVSKKVTKAVIDKVKDKNKTKRQKQAVDVFGEAAKKVVIDAMPEGSKEAKKITKKKTSDFIAEVLNNEEKYEGVLEGVRKNISESDLPDRTKQDVDNVFGELLDDYVSPKSLEKVIGSELGVTPLQAVKDFYSNPEKLGSNLKEYLIDEVGLTNEQSDKLSKNIEKAVESHLTKGKEQRLKQILKVNEDVSPKEYKSLEEKIKEAIKYGAVSQEEFQGVFAEKFGFQNIDPMEALEMEMMVDEIDRLMDEGKITQAQALNKQFNNKLKKLKPKTIVNVMEAINDIHYANMLSGYNTAFNAGIGGFASMNFNTFLYGLRYGLGGLAFGAKTAIKNTPDAIREVAAIIRTNTSAYDDLGVLDERKLANSADGMVESALALPFMANTRDFAKKYLKGEDIELTDNALKEFISSTASRILIVNSIIKAEDAMMRRNAVDVMYAAKEFNEAAKAMGFTGHKIPLRIFNWGKIWEEANKRTGQTSQDKKDIDTQVDAEYNALVESNDRLKKEGKKPLQITNFKGRRRTELWVQKGNEEAYNETLKYTSEWLMMSNPDGITGYMYDGLKKFLRYDPNSPNYANGIKFLASVMLPFARMTAQETNVLMRSVPVLGAAPTLYGMKRLEDGSLDWGWKGNNKELMYQRLLTNALLTGATTAMMVGMFDFDDDGDIVLDPDRLIDFTAGGTQVSKKQREIDMPSSIAIRWRMPNDPKFDEIGDESRWHSLRIIPHLRPVAAYLGRRTDKHKGLLEGDLKGTLIEDFTTSAILSLTESNYNQVARAMKKMERAKQDKTKDVGAAMASGIVDVILSQAKGILTPKVLDDAISDIARLGGKGETDFITFPDNYLNGFYGLDHFLSNEMTDMFGSPKPIKNKLGEWWGKYNEPYKSLPEYKLLEKYPLLKRPLMENISKDLQSKSSSIEDATKEEGMYGERKSKEAYRKNVLDKISILDRLSKEDLEFSLDYLSKEGKQAGKYAIGYKRKNPDATEEEVDKAIVLFLKVDRSTKGTLEDKLNIEGYVSEIKEGEIKKAKREVLKAKILE